MNVGAKSCTWKNVSGEWMAQGHALKPGDVVAITSRAGDVTRAQVQQIVSSKPHCTLASIQAFPDGEMTIEEVRERGQLVIPCDRTPIIPGMIVEHYGITITILQAHATTVSKEMAAHWPYLTAGQPAAIVSYQPWNQSAGTPIPARAAEDHDPFR